MKTVNARINAICQDASRFSKVARSSPLQRFASVVLLATVISSVATISQAESPTDPAKATRPATKAGASSDADLSKTESGGLDRTTVLVGSLTVFVLAVFVGFEIITKVPPTLHTPLMSGSNAISGITLVGALLVTGGAAMATSRMWGFLAVILATVNVVGGFLVTHRMLAMFSKPKPKQ